MFANKDKLLNVEARAKLSAFAGKKPAAEEEQKQTETKN
jgi:hypothetical protein